ncbi:MAG TPA: DUF3164 family protein [Dissulfurispiraceae bacterium]|nr:DUF3164 family protein [Dissulfurispiraceae bacterium]
MTKVWKDEKGFEIPASRITGIEKLKERKATQLLREAQRLHEALTTYKRTVAAACAEVYAAAMEYAGVQNKEAKGNFTWYNFDRSIKIEASVNERIDFDDGLIAAAKDKFYEFLSNNTTGVDEMVRSLIMDAFSTTRGRLDAKRVMGLVRYRERINKKRFPLFHEAVDLIEQSIRRPESRTYFRVWERRADGEYDAIDLNISSISI